MPLSPEHLFLFDTTGYLHLKHALPAADLQRCQTWAEAATCVDLKKLHADCPDEVKHQLNRPVSRILDADPRFALLLDHPAIQPFLAEFLGVDYRHIDNELLHTVPGYAGGGWHRGVDPHPTGHVVDGRFICPMVKVFYCLTDVHPGGGEFVVVPGSHKSSFALKVEGAADFPGQHVFDNVTAGDIILFNEALIHNGRPNRSTATRKTLVINFGRESAGVWRGYRPKPATLAQVSPAQRQVLANGDKLWSQPNLMAEAMAAR
ncbi:MAG TPA: phytanoyl-CoA dioxygenase family protein [Planctomycetota bacterium]|nr:phytanoyl-CoA dioxygenase family protein [Planctomycetota bacterium]